MAYDEKLAAILRLDLAEESDITEKRMFGGLAFLKSGNMLAAVHGSGGAMFRVGKEAEQDALAVQGATPMLMRGRPMGGWIDVEDPSDLRDDARRAVWLGLALAFVGTLPPK